MRRNLESGGHASHAMVVGYVSVQPFEKCREMPKSRVESFSDRVIAFAITLLILDIHLENAGANIDNAGMIQALLALAPRFSIYVISFLICTVAWVSHHELIRRLKAPLAEQSVPDVDSFFALPNGATRSSSGSARGCRSLRCRLRCYVPLFLGSALVRLVRRPSHEKRNS